MSDFPMNKLPEGCKHLYGTLFSVPFALIRTPDPDDADDREKEYKFTNPRLLTESGQADLLDKRLSAELRESIKARTLLNPLVCRWVQDGDSLYPQLVGGDRRYRALDFLIRKKEMVTDPRSVKLTDKGEWEYSECPANEAYNTIPCQIFAVNSDLDALALSWAENKSRINLTEGHEVAEVIKLRKVGATDERILEILQQDEKWLAETDTLVANLDVDTLGDLLEGRIDRASAMELSAIENVELRGKIRKAANEASQEACERKIKRLQRQVEAALDQKEIAEGSVADAEFQEDGESAAEAKEAVAEAEKKVKRTIKERDETTPVTTAKDVRKAAADNGTPTPRSERNGDDRPLRILSAKKISDGLEYLDELIANGGRYQDDQGSLIINIDHLKLARKIINNNILANEAEFGPTIRRHYESLRKPEPKAETEEGQ